MRTGTQRGLTVADITPERSLLYTVMEMADIYGYLVFHDQDSRKNRRGFPDLVMVREGRLIFAELKSQRGRVRPEQWEWADALAEIRGVEVYIWRPSDLHSGRIEEALK